MPLTTLGTNPKLVPVVLPMSCFGFLEPAFYIPLTNTVSDPMHNQHRLSLCAPVEPRAQHAGDPHKSSLQLAAASTR